MLRLFVLKFIKSMFLNCYEKCVSIGFKLETLNLFYTCQKNCPDMQLFLVSYLEDFVDTWTVAE